MNKMIELKRGEVELVGGGSFLVAAGVVVVSVVLAKIISDYDRNSFRAKFQKNKSA